MSELLPRGWCKVRVGDIASVKGGKRLPGGASYSETPTRHPYVRVSDLQDGSVRLAELRYIDESVHNAIRRYVIGRGDVYISIAGTIGITGRVPESLDGANLTENAAKLTPSAAVDPDFLWRSFTAPAIRDAVRSSTIATTQPKLGLFRIEAIELPLPPLNEQRRIVAKLESLQERSRRAREALDAVPTLLDKLRQSILAAAFRGDLTRDFRAKHKDLEPASELLKRIRTERRKKWEEAELAKLTAKGKAPTDDKWKAKYKEPDPVDTTGLPKLPDGWCWLPLGELGENPFSAVQTGPFGAMLHNTDFVPNGVPVIAVGNLTGLGFKRDGLYFITPEKAHELERFDVRAGDVLFARSGATTGKVCVAPSFVEDWRMTGHILRLRLNQSLMIPELAVFALAGAPAVKSQISSNIRGATRPGYNTSLLESILVPVPSLAEQQELVELVHSLLAIVEQHEFSIRTMGVSLSAHDRSILAKAFRGELVPQDPSDEPADVMLARAAGNAASGTERPKRGRSSAKEQHPS